MSFESKTTGSGSKLAGWTELVTLCGMVRPWSRNGEMQFSVYEWNGLVNQFADLEVVYNVSREVARFGLESKCQISFS